MASHQVSKCCTVGVAHEGTPQGEEKQLAGIPTYFAYPEDKKTDNAIILVTDIFGHKYKNAQLIADQFAANGYFTVIPDIFQGDAAPFPIGDDFSLGDWIKSHGIEKVDPVIDSSVKELRKSYGAKRVGGVGYCFGAKYVIRFLKDNRIDVGYCAHPSMVEADELKAITGPLSISAAETDSLFPVEKRHESEQILKDIEATYQLNLFSHVEHGFATRGDLSKKQVKFAKEQAFYQAVQWFDEYLKG